MEAKTIEFMLEIKSISLSVTPLQLFTFIYFFLFSFQFKINRTLVVVGCKNSSKIQLFLLKNKNILRIYQLFFFWEIKKFANLKITVPKRSYILGMIKI